MELKESGNKLSIQRDVDIWSLALVMAKIFNEYYCTPPVIQAKYATLLIRRLRDKEHFEKYKKYASQSWQRFGLPADMELFPSKIFLATKVSQNKLLRLRKIFAKYILCEVNIMARDATKITDEALQKKILFLEDMISSGRNRKIEEIHDEQITGYFSAETTVFDFIFPCFSAELDIVLETFQRTLSSLKWNPLGRPKIVSGTTEQKDIFAVGSKKNVTNKFSKIINIRELSEVDGVKRSLTKDEIRSFYLGSDGGLQWRGIIQGLAVENQDLSETCKLIIRDSFRPFFEPVALALIGDSGSGKSIQMRLLAQNIINNDVLSDYNALWLQAEDDEELEKDIEELISDLNRGYYNDNDKNNILFIDNFALNAGGVSRLISSTLLNAIRNNAVNSFKIIFSALSEQEAYRFFDKKALGNCKSVIITKFTTPDFLNKVCIKAINRITCKDIAPEQVFFSDQAFLFGGESGNPKIFFITYLLGRLEDFTDINMEVIRQELIDNKLIEIVRKDLLALGNYVTGQYDDKCHSRGLRDAFILMCYTIDKGFTGFNAYDFLRFSDEINKVYAIAPLMSNNCQALAPRNFFSGEPELTPLQYDKWKELRFYLRIIHPNKNKRKTSETLISLLHPAFSRIILKAFEGIRDTFTIDEAPRYLYKALA